MEWGGDVVRIASHGWSRNASRHAFHAACVHRTLTSGTSRRRTDRASGDLRGRKRDVLVPPGALELRAEYGGLLPNKERMSRGHGTRWTGTRGGTSCARLSSRFHAASEQTTIGCHPNCGRYLTNLATRSVPVPPCGGKSKVRTRTRFIRGPRRPL